MKIKRVSIYKEFQCTGVTCQVNCCKGWKVPLDDAICEKYRADKKKLGRRFLSSVKIEDGIPTFRRKFGKCPHLGKDNLCNIQKKHGVDYMAHVCRQFPRRLFHLGFFCEETLYLACPEAARLFLEHAKKGERFDFEETEGEVSYEVTTTNNDEDFLAYLLTTREQLREMLENGSSFDSMAILQYGRDAQDACIRGMVCPEPLQYQEITDQRLQLDCADLNKLFFNGFYHPYLKVYAPFLHNLCWKYILKLAIPSRINRKKANRKLAAIKDGLRNKIPNLDRLLNRYFEYYLQTDFLNIFEDYSFSRCLINGVAKINMLWVLLALYAQDRDHITEDEIAKIIAVYERRAPQIKGALRQIHVMQVGGTCGDA